MNHFITACLLMALSTFSLAEPILQESSGKTIPFSSLKGKWVFINYWAQWCQTCLDEIPEFNRFYRSHKGDPIALFAVHYDPLSLVEQKELIQRVRIRYPSLTQDPSDDLHLGDIRGVPVTFVFNPQGALVKTLYGGQNAASLNKIIR